MPQHRFCIVENCHKSGLINRKSFHKLPKNADMRKKWMENLEINESIFKIRAIPVVCRRHFTPECFATGRLFTWAIPTLFLGKTEGLHLPKRNKTVRRCAVRGCTSRGPPVVMHRFPVDREMRKKWLEICQLNDKSKIYICARHFRPSFKHQQRLTKFAYPEFHLGIENSDPLKSTNISALQAEYIQYKEDATLENEQAVASNCKKCKERDMESRQLQEKIDAVRIKIIQLEQKIEMHVKKQEETEYIYLLLK